MTGEFKLSMYTIVNTLVNAMSLEFVVPKLACGACVNTVTQAIHTLDPQATVEADPKTKQVLITSTQPESALREVLSGAGYPAN